MLRTSLWGIFSALLLLSLSGCAITEGAARRPIDDPVLLALQKSAEEITRSFELMASIEQGHAAPPPVPVPASADLHTPISLPVWTGPMVKAVEAVAAQMGYRVSVMGKPSAIEPIVTLDVRNKPAYEVLYNIGLQGGKSAGVRVDARDRTITVIYL